VQRARGGAVEGTVGRLRAEHAVGLGDELAHQAQHALQLRGVGHDAVDAARRQQVGAADEDVVAQLHRLAVRRGLRGSVLHRDHQAQELDLQLRQADLQVVVLVLDRVVEQPVLAPLRPADRRERCQQRQRDRDDEVALGPGAHGATPVRRRGRGGCLRQA
jgi:hypothetical protein